ncbi:MAG: Uxx-star family glutaredoxin-like (seleno)protein [Candidatus Zixiibacteriota bacterium]
MAGVTIYTKPGCPYCAAAMKSFEDKGVEYTECDVKSDSSAADKATELAGGSRVVPVIVHNGEVQVGFGGS